MAILRWNPELMREMRQAFSAGIADLEKTQGDVKRIVGMLQEGALLGQGGDQLADVLGSRLTAKITQLTEKFEEMINDLQVAENAARASDSDAQKNVGLG